jgi:hypothetical protein
MYSKEYTVFKEMNYFLKSVSSLSLINGDKYREQMDEEKYDVKECCKACCLACKYEISFET